MRQASALLSVNRTHLSTVLPSSLWSTTSLQYTYTFDTYSDTNTMMRLTTLIPVGLGLFALVLGAPAGTGNPHGLMDPTDPTAWKNTRTHNYHCEGKAVVRCEENVGGTRSAIDLCNPYCFSNNNGVSCVKLRAPTVKTFDIMDATNLEAEKLVPDSSVTAREASPQEDLHYTCSQNRASVLVCKYGFCSSDHYCRSGTECKDDCSCYKKTSLSARTIESEGCGPVFLNKGTAVTLTTRSRSPKPNISYVCSKDRASVLRCEHGFCSSDYYCAKGHTCSDNPARCKRARKTEG